MSDLLQQLKNIADGEIVAYQRTPIRELARKAAAEIERLERANAELSQVCERISAALHRADEAERQRDEATEHAKYEQQRADGAVEELKAVYVERDEATKRADEAIAALRELVRVAEMDEPRFNEYHDACQTAERLLNQKEGT